MPSPAPCPCMTAVAEPALLQRLHYLHVDIRRLRGQAGPLRVLLGSCPLSCALAPWRLLVSEGTFCGTQFRVWEQSVSAAVRESREFTVPSGILTGRTCPHARSPCVLRPPPAYMCHLIPPSEQCHDTATLRQRWCCHPTGWHGRSLSKVTALGWLWVLNQSWNCFAKIGTHTIESPHGILLVVYRAQRYRKDFWYLYINQTPGIHAIFEHSLISLKVDRR